MSTLEANAVRRPRRAGVARSVRWPHRPGHRYPAKEAGTAMELNNEFEVDRPIGEAWALLTDVERIAPCLPGAQLEEIEGEEYRGSVKVKVGPITANYKGKADRKSTR